MTYSSPLLTAYEFFEKSKDCGISFAYRGPFIDDLTTRIIDLSENNIADNQGLPKISRRVSFLLVECFQNIVRHGEETPLELISTLNDGLFSFKNIGEAYVINSINLVEKSQIKELEQQVEHINSLNSVELKDLYRSALKNNEMSGKGGAGLGLIELARKSGQKIKYKVEEASIDMCFFHQQVLFLKSPDKDGIDHIDFTGDILTNMHRDNLLLQYKGDFSQKSILPLLKIVEDNMGTNEDEIRRMKEVGNMLIEILQNISKYGTETARIKEGVFLIGMNEDNFFIEAGSPVEVDQKEEFERLLEVALSNSNDKVECQIKNKLLKLHSVGDKLKSGLGLLEIVKSSTKPLSYNFTKGVDGKLFFTLKAFV